MHFGFDNQHPILSRNRRAYASDLPGVDIGVAFESYAHLLSCLDASRFTLGHFGTQSKRVHSNDVDYGRGRGEILADACALLFHHAVEGRVDRRISKLLPRDLEFGTPLNYERLPIANLLDRILIPAECDFVFGIGAIELGLRYHSALNQRLSAFEF